MENNTKKADLNISGYGTAAGGEYNLVRINGRSKIAGDITCTDFRINGSCDAEGNVNCKLLHINGTASVSGAAKTGELKILGSADFGGAVSCENATVSGSANFKTSLDAQVIKISGSIKSRGDCNAERFVSSGAFDIDGLLSADHIEINLDWNKSRAKEMGGADITVKPGGGIGVLRSIFGTHSPMLETETIEGNELSLEQVKAGVVRGNNVFLGEGCDIGVVEYKGILRKTGNVKVGEERKV